ncbi:polysaccharide biosynthesis/export family protein [Geopsychrobacter electrodiphilus]|uniref:polysaccharide biosynthesis/export family protein n=1 Tax=Geopsychrobacter electrodiphilus TaxID=225196 RepID=UPI00036DE958|nr:polysaccharide biosynthesis/export family protein [Geopsychrobacter electrodiphilus]
MRSVAHQRPIWFFIVFFLLGGCASYTDLPAGSVKKVSASAVVERQAVSVTTPVESVEEVPSPQYLVGSGDVLYINISARPELGSPIATTGSVAGSRIDGNGNIHLPLVGTVPVAGLSVEQIQQSLRQKFSTYLVDPWVVVEVAEYKSHPLYLLGQFKTAGTFYMDRPLTLLQGLALGGGLQDTADMRNARLIRQNKTQPVDILSLVQDGAARQNVWLHPGDSIYVPDDKNLNVFVFGAVKKPGPVTMPNGRLSLGQALSSAGLDEVGTNLNQIRIIRSLSVTRGELLVVDLEKVMRGEALPFALQEGDIVYAPRGRIGNWNQAIAELLPTLQGVSAILQPFVQIRYLEGK